MSTAATPESEPNTPPPTPPKGPSAKSKSGRKGPSPLTLTLAIVVGLALLFFWLAGFYADILWYDQIGYGSVLWTRWGSMAAMFAIGFVGMALPVLITMMIAYRTRPVYAQLSAQVDRYQEVIDPVRRVAMFGIPALTGLMAGSAITPMWPEAQKFLHAQPFGITDPEFGLDVSFHMFQLPFWRGVVAFVSAVLLVCLVLTIATTFLYGGIRVTGKDLVISRATRIMLGSIAALYLITQAVSFWFDRYSTLTSSRGKWAGALYADTHANIPGLAVLSGAAIIVAIMFLIAAATGRWRLPVTSAALLAVTAMVVTSFYPGVLQSLYVNPSEKQLELPYIERNIVATRTAYGLDGVEVKSYSAKTEASAGQLRRDAATTTNIRLLDPSVVTQTFAQNEQERAYYAFAPTLDVDRYEIDGEKRDAVLAVRELNQEGMGQDAQSWVNKALVYTHGYGVAAAYGNQQTTQGTPVYFQSGMPQSGEVAVEEPRIYFGERSPEYSIVGAPQGAQPIELDYTSGTDANQSYTTFSGNGGPKLDSFLNRLVYSLKFQSEQIFLSESVTSESQILYDRHPVQRVQKVAPYLTVDSDPYPAIVNGEIFWIVDAYTTSDDYPYSTARPMPTADDRQQRGNNVNYIRNSVKATVNAYDGSVTLYAWDTADPVLKTWQGVFPGTIKSVEEMPGDLLAHVRYPVDMFKLQRNVLGTYHVTDPNEFYSQLNAWQVPADPNSDGTKSQPPYYLTMQMPDGQPAFSLYSTFIPRQSPDGQSRNVLTGYIAANSDAGSKDGVVADTYGKLTLLRIDNADVAGPGQVQNSFNTNPVVATELNLLAQSGSDVIRGNLLTLPVGQGFLYVQPVYVRSRTETSYPVLRRVLVSFGDKVGFGYTLDEALDSVFGGDAGADAGDADAAGGQDAGQGGPGDSAQGQESTTTQQLAAAVREAQAALQARTEAYQRNDLVAAAQEDKKLTDALGRIEQHTQQLESETGAQPADPAAPPADAGSTPEPTP